MANLNIDALIGAVQRNCDISDALFAEDLPLCVFLLRMRDLYRWAHKLPFAAELSRRDVGRWIDEREQYWAALASESYVHIPLPGGEADPFDTKGINQTLVPCGLVYSGGLGHGSRPQFFLAQLMKNELRDGNDLFVTGREYARGLVAPPGMLLEGAVFVRSEALRRWLWERYEEWHWGRRNEAMRRALACYRFEDDVDAALDAMTAVELETVTLHELGEARLDGEFGEAWSEMLGDLRGTRAEVGARAVRDLCADCMCTLPGLVEREAPAAIHFYFANFAGMRRELEPKLEHAYRQWVQTGDARLLGEAAAAGLARQRTSGHAMLALHRELRPNAAAPIEAMLNRPQPPH